MPIEGFWSYVHADDDAEGGRISQLARDLVAQYELLTGETIRLFLDRDNLEWGDEWRSKIDDSLASIAFFIPILTPRYFQSAECRRELNTFIRKSQELGLTELLMPILYVDFPAIHTEPSGDELIDLVKPFQWEDWAELRFADVNSSDYRRAVARLAQRLVNANANAESRSSALSNEQRGPSPTSNSDQDDEDDDEPGDLERFQLGIEGMASWSKTLESMSVHINEIGQVLEARTDEINGAHTTPQNEIAVRLRILKATAQDLELPVAAMQRLGETFAQNLYDVDGAVRFAIERAPIEVDTGGVTVDDACDFYRSIQGFAATAEEALEATQGLVDTIAPIERLSRDIRPVLRNLRKSLTRLVEGREVVRAWVSRIAEIGLPCDPARLVPNS